MKKQQILGSASLCISSQKIFLIIASRLGIYKSVFRIHIFLGLPDPDPPVRGIDLDPPSSSKNRTLIFEKIM
jgi:hypothetical protein